jgi:hypothetical protein
LKKDGSSDGNRPRRTRSSVFPKVPGSWGDEHNATLRPQRRGGLEEPHRWIRPYPPRLTKRAWAFPGAAGAVGQWQPGREPVGVATERKGRSCPCTGGNSWVLLAPAGFVWETSFLRRPMLTFKAFVANNRCPSRGSDTFHGCLGQEAIRGGQISVTPMLRHVGCAAASLWVVLDNAHRLESALSSLRNSVSKTYPRGLSSWRMQY